MNRFGLEPTVSGWDVVDRTDGRVLVRRVPVRELAEAVVDALQEVHDELRLQLDELEERVAWAEAEVEA